jgi:hypothetical protein
MDFKITIKKTASQVELAEKNSILVLHLRPVNQIVTLFYIEYDKKISNFESLILHKKTNHQNLKL